MLQFLGNIEAKIDAKARIFVPAAFRKILQSADQNTLILRKDIFQNCLVLYPLQVWEEEVAKLRSRLNRWDREQQALFRQFVVDAERLEMDTNGRILIQNAIVRWQEYPLKSGSLVSTTPSRYGQTTLWSKRLFPPMISAAAYRLL